MNWIRLEDQEPPVEAIVLAAHKVDGTWDYYVAEWDGYFSDAETMRTIEPTPTHWAELIPPKGTVNDES